MVENRLNAKLSLHSMQGDMSAVSAMHARSLVKERIAAGRTFTREQLEKETDKVYQMTAIASAAVREMERCSLDSLAALLEESLKDKSADDQYNTLLKILHSSLKLHQNIVQENRYADFPLPSFSSEELGEIRRRLDNSEPLHIDRSMIETLIAELSSSNALLKAVQARKAVVDHIPDAQIREAQEDVSLRRLLACASILNLKARGKLGHYGSADDQTLCTLVCARERAGSLCDEVTKPHWNHHTAAEMLSYLVCGAAVIVCGAVLFGLGDLFSKALGGMMIAGGAFAVLMGIDAALEMAFPAGVIDTIKHRLRAAATQTEAENAGVHAETQNEYMEENTDEAEKETEDMQNMNATFQINAHPLLSDPKLLMLVSQRTAKASRDLKNLREKHPDALFDYDLSNSVLVDTLMLNREELDAETLKQEIEAVISLAGKSIVRVNSAAASGREQLAESLINSNRTDEELAGLIRTEHLLYKRNREKAAAISSRAFGAGSRAADAQLLDSLSEAGRKAFLTIEKHIGEGSTPRMPREDMAKALAEYRAINELHARTYELMTGPVITADGTITTLDACYPQEEILIPVTDESFEHTVMLTAVVMNLRRTGALDCFSSDEDAAFWFCCSDKLTCSFNRMTAGTLSVGDFLWIAGGLAAGLAAVYFGVQMITGMLATTEFVTMIASWLTSAGVIDTVSAATIGEAAAAIAAKVGLADNIVGLMVALSGASMMDRAEHLKDELYPLGVRETEQAVNLARLFCKRKVSDVKNNLTLICRETDSGVYDLSAENALSMVAKSFAAETQTAKETAQTDKAETETETELDRAALGCFQTVAE